MKDATHALDAPPTDSANAVADAAAAQTVPAAAAARPPSYDSATAGFAPLHAQLRGQRIVLASSSPRRRALMAQMVRANAVPMLCSAVQRCAVQGGAGGAGLTRCRASTR
ncbi:hypothetical protein PORY_000868 [Pneumocystis oryctolagi]|uniref:Uncharacterized protein n=1 Tax=Pneumocystis oryctolagi TaxID=42067 RepID=A0ACB7CG13_9ASCO|nr:hypothetical protein PORY_000868 [Pneumocystis oryctolagi]